MWGTLSMCTSGAVQSAIRRFCSIDSVHVRRKSKEFPNGKVRGWFVLHDKEEILKALDAKWNLVEVQTSWKLEPCFMSATMHSDGSSHNVVDNHTSVSHNTDSDCTALVQESLQLPTVVVESVETIPEDNTPHPICPQVTNNCQSQSSAVSASPHADSHNDNNSESHVSSIPTTPK